MAQPASAACSARSAWSVFRAFLGLGITSFGGPVAHLGYFREAFVQRRQWLTERDYADLVALCQFLPGPASSQVGMGIGLMRAGYPGALMAWIGFTLPSALLLTLAALGLVHGGSAVSAGALHGLKLAALAVVVQATWGMARQFCRGAWRGGIMLVAAAAMGWWGSRGPFMPLVLMALAGVAGWGRGRLASMPVAAPSADSSPPVAARGLPLFWLGCFLLLLGIALAASRGMGAASPAMRMAGAFYEAGSLVFGGGHVVLPLLHAAVVAPGWVAADTFMAGYGLAQAVPGPLFTFAAFLGAVMPPPAGGWVGAVLAVLAIFLPGFLLVAGCLPLWERWRHMPGLRNALEGINAAVVGLLLAVVLQQTLAMRWGLADVCIGGLALAALLWGKTPPWLVVAACAVAGFLAA